MPDRSRTKLALAIAGALTLGLSACSSEGQPPEIGQKLEVVAAFYPLEFLADRVGDDAVNVTELTSGGAEAHDVELSPQQVAQIHDAALVLYVKGFQPAVDLAVAQQAPDTSIDLGAGLERLTSTDDRGKTRPDPHIWLNPQNMIKMADVVTTRLIELAPEKTSDFETRQSRLDRHLESLDSTWERGTQTCESRDLVVSHEAFAYLAARYNFNQIGVSGLSPDAEPSPTRIAEMAELAKRDDVTTVYYESSVDPRVAATIANEAGVDTAILDPLESRSADEAGDYLSVMLKNLTTVEEGQRCR